MNIEIKHTLVQETVKAGFKHKAFTEFDDHGLLVVSVDRFSKSELEFIRKVLSQSSHAKTNYGRQLAREINAAIALSGTNPLDVKVKNLQVLEEAATRVIKQTPRRWVFAPHQHYGWMLPYLVTSIEYKTVRDCPPYVELKARALCRGEHADLRVEWWSNDLKGDATVSSLLRQHSILLATDKLLEDYTADHKRHIELSNQTGEQFLATGTGESAKDEKGNDDDDDWRWWKRKSAISFSVDGSSAKLIMDDLDQRGDESGDAEDELDADDDGDDESEGSANYMLPVHPIVRMFNLSTHSFVTAHTSDLTEYKYDKTLMSKLVLPSENKELIDALTSATIEKLDDVIKGKAAGIIIMCSGTPGTGKTLTAEVYAEIAERPLYAVQCSQLGTDDSTLEQRLAVVLQRATRWRAVLLIDEADVYVHERGADIQQNAVVGVFLRLLEYYRGILFLTTNRATIIDDAIVSRVTAHVRYTIPHGDDRDKLWTMLSANYKIEMTPAMVREAVKRFPTASGRSIRQLLRLAKFIADARKKKFSVEFLAHAAKFHDFSEDELARDKAEAK